MITLIKSLPLPTIVLAMFFFLLPWQTRYIFGFDPEEAVSQFTVVSIYATEILLIVGAVWCCARKRDRPHIAKGYQWAVGLAIAAVAYVALSAVWADYRTFAVFQAFHVGCAVLAFLLLLDHKVNIKLVGLAFVLGLLPPIALGFWQVIFDASGASSWLGLAARDAQTLGDSVTMWGGGRQLRAYGAFPHPNIFGGFLAIGLLSFAYVLECENGLVRKGWGWDKDGLALLLVVALFFTASRSAMLGLLLGLGLAFMVRKMRSILLARDIAVPMAMIVIGGVIAATFMVPNIIAGTRGGGMLETRAIDERHAQYGEWWDVMTTSDAWVFGNGIGQYVRELMGTFAAPIWGYQPVHNVPLLLIAEMGITGFMIMLYTLTRIVRANFLRFPDRDALIAFAMGVTLLVITFFDHYLWTTWAGLVLVAYVAAFMIRAGEEERN